MPGPGKGKRAQKKKWHENASKSIATQAVTTMTTTTTTSSEEPAANDANTTILVLGKFGFKPRNPNWKLGFSLENSQ
jgi:hypothetical protein